jgi:predicted ester cyclase
MPVPTNEAVMRRFWDEFWNNGDSAVVDAIVGDELRNWAEGEKRLLPKIRAAFPDGRWTVEAMVSDGDRVVSRVRLRGTHRSVFELTIRGVDLAVPPTGTVIDFAGASFDRVVDGKIREHAFVGDWLALAAQLGAVTRRAGAP